MFNFNRTDESALLYLQANRIALLSPCIVRIQVSIVCRGPLSRSMKSRQLAFPFKVYRQTRFKFKIQIITFHDPFFLLFCIHVAKNRMIFSIASHFFICYFFSLRLSRVSALTRLMRILI